MTDASEQPQGPAGKSDTVRITRFLKEDPNPPQMSELRDFFSSLSPEGPYSRKDLVKGLPEGF